MVRGLLLALLCWTTAVAAAQKVDHLSINRVDSAVGEPLQLTMNVVGDPFVVSQLRFFLVQDGRQLPLARQMEGDFLITLRSEVPVSERQAKMVVSSLFQDAPDKLIHFTIHLKPQAGNSSRTAHEAAPAAKATQVTEVQPQPPIPSKRELKQYPLEGRTFWSMARETAPTLGVGHYGAMLAFFQTNPECFPGGNPNHLICKVLRCPDPHSLAEWQDEVAAKARFKALMKAAAK